MRGEGGVNRGNSAECKLNLGACAPVGGVFVWGAELRSEVFDGLKFAFLP